MPSGAVKQLAAGGTKWSPLDLPSLRLWLDSTEATTSDWADKSNTANLAQSNSDKRPTLANTINGRQVVTFDGSNDLMATADPGSAVAQPWTMLAVVKPSSTTGNRNVIGNGSTINGPCLYIGSNKLGVFGGTALLGSTNVGTAACIIVGCLNGSNSWVRINGGAKNASGNAGTTGFRGFSVAAYRIDLAADFFAGDMGDVIVCNSTLTDTQLNDAGNYLASRFGLSWTAVT
jgi:hypothetical protein